MSVSEKGIGDLKKPKSWFGVRHVQILMMFLGLTLSFSARVNMSLAIVAMTDPANENSFSWSIQRQSVILSSFAWGDIILQAAAGEMSARFGGMNLMAISLGINSILSLLLPASATYGGWITVCVCRGLQGLTQGIVFPTLHYLIGKWIPLDEKSRVTSFVFAGGQFGTAVQLISSGFIADNWGWPAIFYVYGAVGLIWTGTYLVLGSDNPQVSKRISDEERHHIQTSLRQIGGHKKLKTPWKAILTSPPFLATVAANIGFNWGFWTLLTEIPTYLSNVLDVDIKSNGVMSALPYITMFLMNFPVGFASDYALKHDWISITTARKICNSIGFFGAALVLLCLGYIPTRDPTTAVLLLCLTLGISSGFYNGYIITFLDMAPNFSSQLAAISNFTATVVSLFAPIVAGFVLDDEKNPEEWRIIFYISAALYILTNTIFVIFGSSKKQKWNDGTEVAKLSISP